MVVSTALEIRKKHNIHPLSIVMRYGIEVYTQFSDKTILLDLSKHKAYRRESLPWILILKVG